MKALLLVDIQNDFTPATANKPEGALAVPDGNAVIAVANRLMPDYDLVVATQDYHPAGHKSFASQHPGHAIGEVIKWQGLDQLLWPDHCVQGTPGAELCEGLNRDGIDQVVQKGTDPDIDSYSGFYDNGHKKATGLADLLRDHGVTTVDILGLATDYCVKFTALDAAREGFETNVIVNGSRAVNITKGDEQRALQELRHNGVNVIERKVPEEPLYFYSTKDDYGFFSNFSAHPFMLDGKRWPTTEHYFQAQKFKDEQYMDKIRSTNSPMIAARLGRSRKVPIRADWESAKNEVMRRAVRAKFASHEDIRRELLATGSRKIIEKTTNDHYWGCGSTGAGKNMLGLILMEVRDQMRHSGG
jgi:nicotinamidase/pyrazinamidase